ncbi:MAG: glycosyltransferase family 4 protein [Fibrobacter sp.]|nr:glycosyltransferase family 4 protein [Fibrobacter sp.]
MRIAFFNKFLSSDQPNGVSVQVHRLAQSLVELKHAVTVFSFSPTPADALYSHVKLSWGNDSRLMCKFKPALQFRSVSKEQFDILHYHGDDYLCKGGNGRVRTFYGSALQEAFHAKNSGRFLYQSLFYLFEWISCLRKGALITISESTYSCLPLVKRCIPCGVPLDIYSPGGGIKTDYPSILFIGDLDSRKRGRLLVDTFVKEVLPEFPDSRLTIIGPQPCTAPNVIYAGITDEKSLIEKYRESWIYCLPSSYEGFGVPALEAMACGTPVVATVNAGIREIIRDRVNGVLCEPESLGRTIKELLKDQQLRSGIIANGIESVRAFDIRRIAAEYESLYQQILIEKK